ncbi:MAG: OmpA family protein [Desulfotignum sp.]|nr:OmpA family protein [Desulfotignum sp.]MCF8135860.1 OmpA family protein [Desulfotignum sp.]
MIDKLAIRYLLFFLILIITASCGQKQTKVVLLPQENEAVGAISLSIGDQSVTLDKPYAVSQSGKMDVQMADPEEINKEYGGLFKAELKRPKEKPPAPPAPIFEQFTLYFQPNSVELVPDSEPVLKKSILMIRRLPPARIRVTGYTDTVGTVENNLDLSRKRASRIAGIIATEDTGPNFLEIRGYGEHGLQVSTPDETAEERNRRVIVTILQ